MHVLRELRHGDERHLPELRRGARPAARPRDVLNAHREHAIAPGDVNTISAEELKAKLDRGDDFHLLNALGDWEFRAKRIPRSEHVMTLAEAEASIDPDEEIVVYCSHAACRSSLKLYQDLVDAGFEDVRRFEGGLLAWEEAGFPFEGDDVQPA